MATGTPRRPALWRWSLAGLAVSLAVCAALGGAGVWRTRYLANPLDQAILVTLAYGPTVAPLGLALGAAAWWVQDRAGRNR